MPMAISHFSLFILSIFLFSNPFIAQSSNKISTPLIHKTCKKISGESTGISFKFCLTSLQSGIQYGHNCVDLRCLGFRSINLVHHNVTNTRHQIIKFMRDESLDPYVRLCLRDCLWLYSLAIPSSNRAMRDYRLERYDDANRAISNVMDGASTCEDGFNEKEGVRSPLTKRNGNAFELGSIALEIMNLLYSVN